MNVKEVVENTWTSKQLKFVIREEESVTHSLSEDEYGLKHIPLVDGDTVIDVGAHFGETTLLLTTLGKHLTIYSLEPVSANYMLMLTNITSNPSNCNIVPLGYAVGGKNEKAIAQWYDISNLADFITLDTLFERLRIQKCKLLIIDCEGCEYEALCATSKDTFKKIQYIVGEWHFKSRHELHECVLPLFADKTEEKGLKGQWQDSPPVGLFFFENYIKI